MAGPQPPAPGEVLSGLGVMGSCTYNQSPWEEEAPPWLLAIHGSSAWPWPFPLSPPPAPGEVFFFGPALGLSCRVARDHYYTAHFHQSPFFPKCQSLISICWSNSPDSTCERSYIVFPSPPISLLCVFPQSIPCPHHLSSSLLQWDPERSL